MLNEPYSIPKKLDSCRVSMLLVLDVHETPLRWQMQRVR
jgi:hypothetical protein